MFPDCVGASMVDDTDKYTIVSTDKYTDKFTMVDTDKYTIVDTDKYRSLYKHFQALPSTLK